MKKTLACLGSVAVCASAMAQSSVTLFGIADTGYSYYTGQGTGSVSKVTAGNMATSRLGFRGVEDLGGGLTASFWFEAGLNTDTGAGSSTNTNNQASGAAAAGVAQGMIFNRRSTVSLGGGWGEIRLGRDYTPSFWNLTVFDPFAALGSAQASNLTAQNSTITRDRASNSIGYFTPGCSRSAGCTGFYGQVMYAMGENGSAAAAPSDGNYVGTRIGYATDIWNVAAAYGVTKNVAAGNYKQSNVGGSYDFKVAKAMVQIGNNTTGVAGAVIPGVTKAPYVMLGATIPVGAGYIPVSYTRTRLDNANGTAADQIGMGYVYNFSARTAVYLFYARLSNKNGLAATTRFAITGGPAVAAVNGLATGMDIGIRHTF